MRKARQILLTIVPLLAATGVSAAEPGDSVEPWLPVPAAPEGAGTFAGSTSDGGVSLATANGSGARLVARGSLLAIAGDHARLRFPVRAPDTNAVEPLDGAVRLLVGAGGARLELSGFALDLSRAEVLLARQEAAWVIQVVAVLEGGSATLHLPPPPSVVQASAAEPGTEVPVPARPPRILAAGDRFVLAAGTPPAPASPAALARLDAAGRSLPAMAPAPLGSRLRPLQVEDPADFSVSRGRGGAGGAEVEIEAVEVEVGCVEVCVD